MTNRHAGIHYSRQFNDYQFHSIFWLTSDNENAHGYLLHFETAEQLELWNKANETITTKRISEIHGYVDHVINKAGLFYVVKLETKDEFMFYIFSSRKNMKQWKLKNLKTVVITPDNKKVLVTEFC